MNRILLRKLRRDLWGHKGAIAALVVIIAVGIGCYVGFDAVWRDMDAARHHYYTDYRLADFSVHFKRAPAWAVDALATLPNVRAVRGRVVVQVLIELPGRDEPISGTAISMPEDRTPVLNDVLLRSGGWFSRGTAKEAILNEAFARENGLRPGDRIKALLVDQQHEFLVVGTAMSPEFVYLIPQEGGLAPDPARFGVLYLPERFLQESSDLDGAFNQCIGLAHKPSDVELEITLERIKERLDPYGVAYTARMDEQISVRFLADELRGIWVSSKIMPGLFLAVAALVLNVLLGRIVAGQRTVIGTLKAIGYSTARVTVHYLGYGVAVGAAGGLAGLVFGYWMEAALVDVYRQFFALPGLHARAYPHLAASGLLVSVGAAMLGTLKGVLVAARLRPAEAMRPPPPERGARVLPERIPRLWRPLPFRWKMVLRAVFRNPFRSSVSIAATTVATALVLAGLANVDALEYLVRYEFERMSHQDVTIQLRDPEGPRAAGEVQGLPSISGAEPQLVAVCDLRHGPYRKRIGVTGLVPDSRLYTPLDRAGKPIVVPEEGLVLAKKLAEILHASPGDRLQVRALVGRREEALSPVAGTVDTFLGLSAYAHIGYLNRLIGEERSANHILARSYRRGGTTAFFDAVTDRPAVVGVGERKRSLTRLDETFGETMGTMISLMVLFAGLIAFGSVLNAAMVSLSERRREVGTMRVLGYSPTQAWFIFAGEAILLNGGGILVGLAGGIGLSYAVSLAYSTELYRFPTIIYPSRLVESALLMIAFVGVAQLIVHRLVRRLNWLSVLAVKE